MEVARKFEVSKGLCEIHEGILLIMLDSLLTQAEFAAQPDVCPKTRILF
jgi:hypothetical protein